MTNQKHILWQENEYAYPMSGGFVPFLTGYVHPDAKPRPAMVVAPGGAYCFVAPSESGPVAEKFYEAGYNAFVLAYTVNPLGSAPLGMRPLRDLSRAVRFVRRNAAGFHIDPDRLAVCGFSAGGHLSASLCVHWPDVQDPDPAYASFSNRPNAAILSYPVITAGEYAHRGSFENLLGPEASPEDLAYMSLENHVGPHTPPCFLWQTAEDGAVPVENSYLFAQACRAAGVDFAHHVFTKGQHGLALADAAWLRSDFGEPYTTGQLVKLREAARSGALPGVAADALDGFFAPPQEGDPAYRAQLEKDCRQVEVWPQLAKAWLDGVWEQRTPS